MKKIEDEGHVSKKKEGMDMSALAKPINRMAVIKEPQSRNFVREFNDNKVTKEFLASCKKAGNLFGKKK